MANLAFSIHDFEGSAIRATTDGRFSVFDVLVALGVADKASNAKNVFDRLAAQGSEVTTACSKFKFPGRGQRETPVATEEEVYQILMQCPGARADEFRRWAAGILADPEKAVDHAIANYLRQGKDYQWIKARLEGKVERRRLTDILKAHGVTGPGYAICTDEINKGLFGKTAKQLKAERGAKVLRDSTSRVETIALSLAEAMSGDEIEQGDRMGNRQCAESCSNAARKVRRVFE